MPNEYTPSPEVIRRRCLEIQATWDEETRRQRAGLPATLLAVCETTCDPAILARAIFDSKQVDTPDPM